MYPRRRAILTGSLILILVALATCVYLTDVHVHANSDPSYMAACDINTVLRCSDVAVSPYSIFLRLPISVWGLLAYGCMLCFVLWGLQRQQVTAWPAGLYWLLNAGALLAAVALALIAELIIGALCIGCLILYGVNLLLFAGATWLIVSDRGALRRDLVGLLRNRAAVGLGVGFAVAAAALILTYPKYWEAPLQAECDGLPAGVDDGRSCWIGARDPVLEITEFSDYRCPFCQRAHFQLRALVREYPKKIRLTHKHFPLDRSCRPDLPRQLHDGACQMAMMAYCAGVQGKFWDFNDRLFSLPRGQTLDPKGLAAEAGLEVDQFLDCLASPAAAEHVQSDIDEGIRLNITATPTFVVDGQLYVGQLPDEILQRYLGSHQ